MSAIQLTKNTNTHLKDEKGSPVVDFSFGVNWGKINRASKSKAAGFLGRIASKIGAGDAVLEDVDLDLSLIMVGSKGEHIDTVYFGQTRSKCRAVNHTGDDRSGDDEDDGIDNEIITVSGLKVDNKVKSMFAVLNSYTHQKFDEIPYIGINFYDGFVKNGKGNRLYTFNIENDKMFNGKESAVLARIDRTGNGWNVNVIAECTNDNTLTKLRNTAITKYLS